MQLFVKDLSGKTLTIEPRGRDSSCVLEAMELMHVRTGIPVEECRLRFAGTSLDPERTLRSYGIRKETVLHMAGPRLKGC
jgi:hypothetical protein